MVRISKRDEKRLAKVHGSDGKLTILVIDDVSSVVDVIAKGLKVFGHTVLAASSGRMGMEIFKEHPVDVVLCDLTMPDMDGWEVGKVIRTICEQRGVLKSPFILVTGCGPQISHENRLVESGVDAVVGKPVELGDLLAVITETIHKPIPE
jgi:CheY-like chemotaxis protein